MGKASTTISRVVAGRAGERGRSRLAHLGRLIVIGALGVFVVYALWPIYLSSRPRTDQTRCMGHLKTLHLCSIMYANDHDDTLAHRAWADALVPYVGSDRHVFYCRRREKRALCACNEAVLGYRLTVQDEPGGIPMLFDVAGRWNISGGRKLIEYPHDGAANVLTTDGLVLRVAPHLHTSHGLEANWVGDLEWGTPPAGQLGHGLRPNAAGKIP